MATNDKFSDLFTGLNNLSSPENLISFPSQSEKTDRMTYKSYLNPNASPAYKGADRPLLNLIIIIAVSAFVFFQIKNYLNEFKVNNLSQNTQTSQQNINTPTMPSQNNQIQTPTDPGNGLNNSTPDNSSKISSYNLNVKTDYEKRTGYVPLKSYGVIKNFTETTITIDNIRTRQIETYNMNNDTVITTGIKKTDLEIGRSAQIEYEGYCPSNTLRIWVMK